MKNKLPNDIDIIISNEPSIRKVLSIWQFSYYFSQNSFKDPQKYYSEMWRSAQHIYYTLWVHAKVFPSALFLQVAYVVMHIIYYSHLFRTICKSKEIFRVEAARDC